MILEQGGVACDMDVSLRDECSVASYPLLVDQLCVSVLTPIYCKKSAFLMRAERCTDLDTKIET